MREPAQDRSKAPARASWFHPIFLPVWILIFGPVPHSPGQQNPAPTLSSLKFQFDVKRAELQKPEEALQKQYEAQLHQLLNQVTEAADLDRVNAVKAELEGFRDGDPELAGNDFPELRHLQGIYDKAAAERIAVRYRELGAAFKVHLAKLAALERRLTRELRPDEARLVSEEIEKVEKLAREVGNRPVGASFFGVRSTGNRFLFVLDHTAWMRQSQFGLRDAELEQTLTALPRSVQYQVLLFAGGAFYAEEGWDVTNGGRGTSYSVVDPDGKVFPFRAVGGAMDWEFDGPDSELPKAKWLSADEANVGKTMKFIRKTRQFYGADWEMALRIAHRMEPPPSAIFFLAAGTGGYASRPILAVNKKSGNPKINTFALQTRAGVQQLMEIAEGTGGTFVVVLKDGETASGKEYFKDPGKYNALIR